MPWTPPAGSRLARMKAAEEALQKRLAEDADFRDEWYGMMAVEAAKYDYDPADDYDGGPA